MKLGNQGTDLVVVGAESAPTQFKINASAGAFNLLSSGIYNDKPGSIMRELGCNAVDAHVAAKTPEKPFEVHIPTTFDSTFMIKDYGTGLAYAKGGCIECKGSGVLLTGQRCPGCEGSGDYDAVKRLFATYFASDKNDSNEFVGAFGLGSKSPFSYTNKKKADGTYSDGGFTVSNRYFGRTYFYTAAAKFGIPSIVLMGVEDTLNEPNGVSVSFPVEPNDVWEFENKAAIVYEFFDPKPIFNKPITVVTQDYSVKTPLWAMRKNAMTAQSSGLRAIQGGVPYSVGNIDISRLNDSQQSMVEMPIDLFFSIGELAVTLSRETLQLDETTIAFIIKRLDQVQIDLMEELKKQIAASANAWTARWKIHELSLTPGIGPLVRTAYSKGQFDGQYGLFSLSGTKTVVNELDYPNIHPMKFFHVSRSRAVKADKRNAFAYSSVTMKQKAQELINKGESRDSFNVTFSVSEKTLFIVNDLKKGIADKYVHYLVQKDSFSNYDSVYLLQRNDKFVPLSKALIEIEAFLADLGGAPSIKVTELKEKYDPLMKELKETRKTTRNYYDSSFRGIRQLHLRAQKVRYRRWGSRSGYKKQWTSPDSTNTDINDPSITKYYILINKWGVPNPIANVDDGVSLVSYVNKFRNSLLLPEIGTYDSIYGLYPDSKYLKDASFVEFTSFVKEKVESILTPEKKASLSLAREPFNSGWKYIVDYVNDNPTILEEDSPLRLFTESLSKAKPSLGDDSLVEMAQFLHIPLGSNINFNVIFSDVLNNNYPLLNFVRRDGYGRATIGEMNPVIEYIRWMDERNKMEKLVLDSVEIVDEVETEEEETING